MVGKIKRVRQKLHQDAVKITNINNNNVTKLEKFPVLPINIQTPVKSADVKARDAKAFSFPKGIFAGTVIPQEALVQTLKVSEPPAVQQTTEQQQQQQQQRDDGEKKQQSKKERMKERRQKWLNKISAIKLAREQQAELARRKATPVVGDMRSLVDALPELQPFIKASISKKQKGSVKKKAEPTDYCQMKPAQKRKLLETEASRFNDVMKDSTFKINPLAAIGEHLRKRLKQEDEQS